MMSLERILAAFCHSMVATAANPPAAEAEKARDSGWPSIIPVTSHSRRVSSLALLKQPPRQGKIVNTEAANLRSLERPLMKLGSLRHAALGLTSGEHVIERVLPRITIRIRHFRSSSAGCGIPGRCRHP